MPIFTHQDDLPADIDLGKSVAIDTEAMGLKTHRDRLCVVQLSAGDGDAHLVKINHPQAACPNLAALLAHKKAGHKNLQQAYFWAIAARNNAVRTGDNRLDEARIARLVRAIRARIPHADAAKASSAAARLTGQPV